MSFVFAANIVSLSPVLASSVPSPKAVVVGCAVVDDGAFLIDVASNKLNAFCSEGLCVLCAPGKSFTKRNRIVRQIKTVVLSHIFFSLCHSRPFFRRFSALRHLFIQLFLLCGMPFILVCKHTRV